MLCTKKKSGSVGWFVPLSMVPLLWVSWGLIIWSIDYWGLIYVCSRDRRIKKVICCNISAEQSLKENGSTVQDFILDYPVSISCFDLRNHFFFFFELEN